MPQQDKKNNQNNNNSPSNGSQDPAKELKDLFGLDDTFSADIGTLEQQSRSVPESIDVGADPAEYTPYTGSQINPLVQDINRMRGEEQSHWAQLGNFGVQLAAEVGGGSIEGAGYILDIPEMAIDKAKGAELDLGNAISEFGKSIREGSKEALPIYTEEQGGFNPWDLGWWTKNGVSIASTLSLAIPAYGASRAVGGAGRLAQKLGGLSKAERGTVLSRLLTKGADNIGDVRKGLESAQKIKQGANTFNTALFSRHAENLMEAVPLYEEKYNEYKEKGIPDQIAREKAGEAAMTSYKLNSAFLLQDIGTFSLLGKASRSIGAKASRSGKAPSMPTWGESILEMGTEGVEEAYQYAVEKEAGNMADISAGVEDPSHFADRLQTYMNGEMATGAFFGALGSGVFRAVGSRVKAWAEDQHNMRELRENLQQMREEKGRELTDEEVQEQVRKQEKKSAREKATGFTNLTNANQLIDKKMEQKYEKDGNVDSLFHSRAITQAVNELGTLDRQGRQSWQGLQSLEAFAEMTDEEMAEAFGGEAFVNKNTVNDARNILSDLPQLFEENLRKYDESTARSITLRQGFIRSADMLKQRQKADLKEQIQSDENYQDLENTGKEFVDREVEIKGMKKAEEVLRQHESTQELAEQIAEKRKAKEQKQKKRKSKERDNEDAISDQELMSAMQPMIEKASTNRSKIEINNARIEAYNTKIEDLQQKYVEKQQKRQQQPQEPDESPEAQQQIEELENQLAEVNEELDKTNPAANQQSRDKFEDLEQQRAELKQQLREAKGETDVVDPEDTILEEVDSLDDLNDGDEFVITQAPEMKMTVTEDDNGNKFAEYPNGNRRPLAEFTKNSHVKKVIDTAQAEIDAKADLSEGEATEYSEQIVDDYDPHEVDRQGTDIQKETIQSASWKSIHNPDNLGENDPDEIARTNWAETPMEIRTSDGSPRYEVEFERESENVDAETGAIRAYVVDKTTGERVTENGREVFFYVHEPGFEGTRDSNPDEKIRNFRENILQLIDQGKTPVSPITNKTGGVFRWKGEVKDVETIVNPEQGQSVTLAISDSGRNYRNKDGVPQGFRRMGNANPNQTGRVYALVQALDGSPRPLPLERKTLDGDLAQTVTAITNDIIAGAKPGDVVSDTVLDRLKGDYGQFISDYVDVEYGGQPTYKQLLDLIVLEGGITNKMSNPAKKKFHIDTKNNQLHFGEETIAFNAWNSNREQFAEDLAEFLQDRHINVLRSKLGQQAYDRMLMDSEILYQTNELPVLIQPSFTFGQVYSDESTVDETITEEDAITERVIRHENSPYIVNITGTNVDIVDQQENSVEAGSKKWRQILAKVPEDQLNHLELGLGGQESAVANQGMEDINEEDQDRADPDDVDEAFGDMQRLPSSVTGSLRPVLEGLKRRTGIPYIIVNEPDADWAGVYEDGTAFINIDKAGDDTPFHEYAHPIIRQIKENSPILYNSLMSEISQDPEYARTYQKVAENYPEYDNDQLIEESLVQIIGRKASTKPVTQSAIQRLWNKIKDYIKSFFTEVNVDDLDTDTSLADIADLLRGQQHINVEQNPMAMYQKVDESMSWAEHNSWMNSIMFALIRGSNVSDYTQADQLDFDIVREKLDIVGRNSATARKIRNELFNENDVVDRSSDWYNAINEKLSKFNIAPRQQMQGETFDDVDSFDFQPDYFFNGKDKASSFVKMIFSTVPKIERIRDDGSKVPKKNRHTGMPEFHSFNDIWNLTNKALSDTVEDIDESGVGDIYDKFMDRLSDLQQHRPEIEYIVRELQDAPDWKRGKFVSTFYQANQNYSMMIYDGKFKLQKNEPTAVENKITQRWQERFANEWFDRERQINAKKQQDLKNRLDGFKDRWIEDYIQRTKAGPIKNSHKEDFVEILDELGLDFSEQALDYMLQRYADNNENMGKKDALNHFIRIDGLNRLIYKQNQGALMNLKREQDNKTNFINNQSIARRFIEAESAFRQDLGTASVFGPGNNTYYNYSNFSMMGKLLKYYQNNPAELQSLKNMPFYNHSKWANEDIIKDLYITNNMSFKQQGGQGIKMKSLNAVDRVIVDINKTLQGQFSMMARGANATEFNIAGAPVERSFVVSQDGSVSLNTDATRSLASYIYDELERVRATRQFIAENDQSKYVEGYHTKVKHPVTGEDYVPGLTMFLAPDIMSELKLSENMSRENFVQNDAVQDYVKKMFNTRVMELENFFTDHQVSSEQLNNKITPDSSRYSQTSNPLDAKLYDYVYNGMIANLEQQKLFAADTAMFESVPNMQKRILANGSMGTSWYIREGENETYQSAVINDVAYDSDVWEDYTDVEVTDAQAWVTPDFYINALKGYGKWTPEHDDALQRIRDGRWTDRDISLFMQPLKTVHFERVQEDGLLRPVYDKQTIMPLIPQAIQNSSLMNLLNNMRFHNVDHVAVSSGKKLGRKSPTDAIDNETLEFKDEFELHPTTQSKRYTFLQTPMPTKGRGNLLQGSQQKYNVFADLNPDLTHEGKNVITQLHRIQSAISDVSTREFIDSISTDGNVDRSKLYNKLLELSTTTEVDHQLADYLEDGRAIEAIPSHNIALQNRIMSLIRDTGAKIDWTNGFRGIQASRVGWDQLTQDDRSDIVWLDDPNLKPPRKEDGEFKKGQVLIPHTILEEYNLDVTSDQGKQRAKEILSGFMYRIPNQATSNIAMFEVAGILPKYMGDTVVPYGELNEQMGADNDGDKLDLMMYNYIGEQQPQKVDYWDEFTGDKEAQLKEIYQYRTEVLDEDIGSEQEFVDRYMDLPILQANSKRGLENYLIDMYEVALSSDSGFENSTAKLESGRLEDLITQHENYDQQDLQPLQFADPFFQAQVRDSFINANSGVGQVSNHILDHVKSQNKNIYYTTEANNPKLVRGVPTNTIETDQTDDNGNPVEATLLDAKENVNGEKISSILSEFMNAQVDAEKNDYAPRGNFNTQTNSVALAMVRAGVPLENIVDIVGSDIVRTYTRYKKIQANQLIDTNVDPLERTLQDHNISEDSFWELTDNDLRIYKDFEALSSGLSKSIQKTRFSAHGGGATFASAIAYEKMIDAPVDYLANVDAKFEQDGGPSMEQSYYDNLINKLTRGLFEDQSIALGDSFHRVIDHLQQTTQFEPINYQTGDTSAVENLYFDFYNYVMSGAFSEINREDLISGENSVAQRVRKYQESDADNQFVNDLIPSREGGFDFIQTSNAVRVDNDIANIYEEAWEDLLQENEQLALDLGRLAYFQSGYKRNLHSFHEYMPKAISDALGIKERFNEIQSEDAFDGFIDQYIRHNSEDNRLVPKVTQLGDEQVDFQQRGDYLVLSKDVDRFKSNEGKLVPFVKKRDQIPGGFVNRLYELVATNENGQPIYAPTPKLGYDNRGMKFYEYDLESTKSTPIFNQIEYPQANVIAGTTFNLEQAVPTWKDQQNNDPNPFCPS